MLLEILITILIGILIGTFTGLIPGIHINLVGVILVSLSFSFFSGIDSVYIVVFIASAAITHTFVDFIPSVFLGCPDTDTELSVLPGHKLLKEGRGYEAIILSAYGGLASLVMLLLVSYPSIKLIPLIYDSIKNLIPFLLILVSLILIIMEKRKFTALFVFLITGILGLLVLRNPIIEQPLLPLLTGLFGSASILMSIKNKTKIPKQIITKMPKITKKPLIGAFIASPLCSFLPGLGSGQAAIIGNTIAKTDNKGFLILLGATNTLVMSFSFVCLYMISRTRTGAAVAIKEIIGIPSEKILLLIIFVTIVSGIISFFIVKSIAKNISERIHKINYKKISLTTLTVLTLIVIVISKLNGLFIFLVATITGYYCISQKIKRTNMMGCLIIPTIFWYLF